MVPSPLAPILRSYKSEGTVSAALALPKATVSAARGPQSPQGREPYFHATFLLSRLAPDHCDLECIHKATPPSHSPNLLAGLSNSLGEPRERGWGRVDVSGISREMINSSLVGGKKCKHVLPVPVLRGAGFSPHELRSRCWTLRPHLLRPLGPVCLLKLAPTDHLECKRLVHCKHPLGLRRLAPRDLTGVSPGSTKSRAGRQLIILSFPSKDNLTKTKEARMMILEIRVEEAIIRSFGRSPHTALTQPWLLYQGCTCVSVTFSGPLQGFYKAAEMAAPWRASQCTSVRARPEGGAWKGKPAQRGGIHRSPWCSKSLDFSFADQREATLKTGRGVLLTSRGC